VRVYRVDAETAPELAAVVRFLRDASGYESLGIGYAAMALRAAPAGSDTSEILASIGSLADRLARRASARRADSKDTTLAAHVDVAQSYGVKFRVVEPETVGGRARICYDGEAWEQLLAVPTAPPIERARAALFLAADPCRDPAQPPTEARLQNDRRLRALESIDFATANAIPAALAGRVRLRHAEALAWRAFDQARQGNAEAAARSEGAAVRELALCDRGVLAPEDLDLYEEVAVRVAASRWATETPPKDAGKRAVAVTFAPRAPGETCVRVVERAGDKPGAAASPGAPASPGAAASHRLLGERCTFGVVWPSALRWAPSGTAATLAVQPLPAWTELWTLRRGDDGSWTFDTLTAAITDPDVGYVESAGFSPDGNHLLVVREARVAGHIARRFQVLGTSALAVEKWASNADKLIAFKRWSAPSWRTGTLALR
jgi:hypothetical protein